MADRRPARSIWPALDIRFSSSRVFQDHILPVLDDFDLSALEGDDEDALMRAFFGSIAARDRACAALRSRFGEQRASFDPIDLPDEDWAARSQRELHAVRVGRIVVAPPWDQPLPPEGENEPIVIVIVPSMGFGTGHHPTTRLALMALQTLDLHGRPVLDVGTGSGVLAIAAVRLGAARAIGIDHDSDALAAAADNIVLNGVESQVSLEETDVRQLRIRAGVIVANLTGALIETHAGHLASLVEPAGFLVVSGFLKTETSRRARSTRGWRRSRSRAEDEWL